jgi:hypothetical protein
MMADLLMFEVPPMIAETVLVKTPSSIVEPEPSTTGIALVADHETEPCSPSTIEFEPSPINVEAEVTPLVFDAITEDETEASVSMIVGAEARTDTDAEVGAEPSSIVVEAETETEVEPSSIAVEAETEVESSAVKGEIEAEPTLSVAVEMVAEVETAVTELPIPLMELSTAAVSAHEAEVEVEVEVEVEAGAGAGPVDDVSVVPSSSPSAITATETKAESSMIAEAESLMVAETLLSLLEDPQSAIIAAEPSLVAEELLTVLNKPENDELETAVKKLIPFSQTKSFPANQFESEQIKFIDDIVDEVMEEGIEAALRSSQIILIRDEAAEIVDSIMLDVLMSLAGLSSFAAITTNTRELGQRQ